MIELTDGRIRGRRADGLIDRIGTAQSRSHLHAGAQKRRCDKEIASHADAVQVMCGWLAEQELDDGITASGHRVVHGGSTFTRPTLVDDDSVGELESMARLAPLHNAGSVSAIRATRAALGAQRPAVAVFDTAFHAELPPRAANYAIRPELAQRHNLRRFGFHGLAHRSMLESYCTHRGKEPSDLKLVTLQLGSGCSAAAILHGRSVDTSMGLTPLEGLMMGTRSGDVDPAVVAYLAEAEQVTAGEVVEMLNRDSGLLGVSGLSSDVRALLHAEDAGHKRAAAALDMFCYRLRKAVGGHLAALDGADAVVFGGGIGTNAPAIRARVCAGLSWAGVAIDAERNARLTAGLEGSVSQEGAAVDVFVAVVDEERMVALETLSILVST